MKIINVVGTRPNFMKIAPIIRAMNNVDSIDHILVHTGQHYDHKMSKNFFDELEIPTPDVHLEVGSDTQTKQTAKIMIEFEKVCDAYQPDYILVVGDVNSTMACSVVAAKKNIEIVHVEAGIRSRDREMPEEINRLITDSITNYLLPPSQDAVENLLAEGHSKDKIALVGNVMIDTLLYSSEKIKASTILDEIGIEEKSYATLTMHRPSNTDDIHALSKILDALEQIQTNIPIIFPIHPRTEKMIKTFGLEERVNNMKNLKLLAPLGYFDFGKLIVDSKFVITDSGGIQEETTVYGIPCITIRKNTERPITITEGTNLLVGNDTMSIVNAADKILNGQWKKGNIPQFWDGKTAERIVDFLISVEAKKQN